DSSTIRWDSTASSGHLAACPCEPYADRERPPGRVTNRPSRLRPVWPFGHAVALGHGHNGATLASPGVFFFAAHVFQRVFDFEEGCEGFPWVAGGGHGDVLGEGWKERDGGRVVIRLDSDRGLLGWVVGVAPQVCIQAAGGLVPPPDAGLV